MRDIAGEDSPRSNVQQQEKLHYINSWKTW